MIGPGVRGRSVARVRRVSDVGHRAAAVVGRVGRVGATVELGLGIRVGSVGDRVGYRAAVVARRSLIIRSAGRQERQHGGSCQVREMFPHAVAQRTTHADPAARYDFARRTDDVPLKPGSGCLGLAHIARSVLCRGRDDRLPTCNLGVPTCDARTLPKIRPKRLPLCA
jgi:hypothetical protein